MATRTEYYFNSLSKLITYVNSVDVITYEVYSEMMVHVPGDLACRLRLVPDLNLASRLAHINAMITDLNSGLSIANQPDFELISIEGSDPYFKFDMDLIIRSSVTGEFWFVDYTSSQEQSILNKKMNTILTTIALNSIENAKAHVLQFEPRKYVIDIKTPILNKEPAAYAFKLIDALAALPARFSDDFLQNCATIFNSVNDDIYKTPSTVEPGLYDITAFSPEDINYAKKILQSQSDNDSYESLVHFKDFKSDYIDSFIKICESVSSFKKSLHLESAQVSDNAEFESILKTFSNHPLMRALLSSMLLKEIVAITDAGSIKVLESFPGGIKASHLPFDSPYSYVVSHIGGHVFRIIMNVSVMKSNLARVLLKTVPKPAKKLLYKGEAGAVKCLRAAVSSIQQQQEHSLRPTTVNNKTDVWNKTLTIAALSSNDLESLGHSSTSLLEGILNFLKATYLGSSISHFYEVSKTIAASLKTSPGDNYYYLGVNGSLASLTLVKMSSVADSFTRCSFQVYYKSESPNAGTCSRMTHFNEFGLKVTDFYTMDSNQLVYNLKLPYTLLSLSTWAMENVIEDGSIKTGTITSTVYDSFLHVSVNRDAFAQASEQIRYFFMGAIGQGSDPSSIASKVNFINIKHPWELLYILRMFKVGLNLSVISSSGNLGKLRAIEAEDSVVNYKDLVVTFPHSRLPCVTFNQIVNSMYLCNVYNKFRSFHEVSEAACFNELIVERAIYNNCVNDNKSYVAGLSSEFMAAIELGTVSITDYIMSEGWVHNEIMFVNEVSQTKPGRYKGSICYIIGACKVMSETPTRVIDDIYHELGQSPIEACTMRGSMDSGPSTDRKQGIRAASSILEDLIRELGLDPKNVNHSVIGPVFLFDKIKQSYHEFNIFNKGVLTYAARMEPYRYRIVQKDQKGYREISVLNASFRVGSLFVETVAKTLTQICHEVEVVNNPEKDMIVEQAIKKAFDRNNKVGHKGVLFFDNSDQKRWGPNHNMNFFLATVYGTLHKDLGMVRLIMAVLDRVMTKRAKFPETLIDLIKVKKVDKSASSPINFFIQNCRADILDACYEMGIPYGMCQGIFHALSSLHHAIMALTIERIARKANVSISIKSFVTSDDALRIVEVGGPINKYETMALIHDIINKVGNLFNILRGSAKSAFNFHIAELNSNFYKNGQLATPSLKQRISKLDVGKGVNYVEDYMDGLSSAANYLSQGGSYMGATILSILNLTLHTEQWLRWGMVTSDNYYKPVELGGFPVIEPITVLFCGAISSIYLRSKRILTPEAYTKLYTEAVLAQPEEMTLEDYIRRREEVALDSDRRRVSPKLAGLAIHQGAGPLGLMQLVRTDKKLSQFEKRHGMSKWPIPDSFVSLNRRSSEAGNFIFSIMRDHSISVGESNVGVNSFFLRFIEPWIAFNRKAYKVSKESPFKNILALDKDLVSHSEILSIQKALTLSEASSKMKYLAESIPDRAERRVMISQIRIRLEDAKEFHSFLSSQEASSFIKPNLKTTIKKVILKGHTAMDLDTYTLSILKALAGEKSKTVINNFKRSTVFYDSIPITAAAQGVDLLAAVIQADNATSIFNKYIRRSTKMLIPHDNSSLAAIFVDILKSKFTEMMGMKISSRPDVTSETEASFSHSDWVQSLINHSKNVENQLANNILSGRNDPVAKMGIISNRPIIVPSEPYQLSSIPVATKSKIITSTHKDAFMHEIKTWLGANATFLFSNQSLTKLIAGKLTYKHDYYLGTNIFARIAPKQYIEVKCQGVAALHLLTTSKVFNRKNNRDYLLYRHNFIFNFETRGLKVTAMPSKTYKNEKWVLELCSKINSMNVIIPNYNYTVATRQPTAARKGPIVRTYENKDSFMISNISSGTEFEIDVPQDSLTICIKSGKIHIPITYLQPMQIEAYSAGYTLTHSLLLSAVDDYFKLKTLSSSFDIKSFRSDPKLARLMDFIIVGSTVATHDSIIIRELGPFGLTTSNSHQLDVLRTCLVSDPNIGINVASARFNQFVNNLGHRRLHFHNYFSRKITGSRAEWSSEYESDSEQSEEFIHTSNLGPRFVTPIVPPTREEIIATAASLVTPDQAPTWDSWADELDYADVAANTVRMMHVLQVQTITPEEESHLFSDSDSEANTILAEEHSLSPELQPTTDPDAGICSFLDSIMDPSLLLDSSNDVDSDLDSEGNELLGSIGGIDSITNELDVDFIDLISREFPKVEKHVEPTIESEVSGFTANPVFETPTAITSYIRKWLETSGAITGSFTKNLSVSNISQITDVYMFARMIGASSDSNILETVTGEKIVSLPMELSALAVINSQMN
jgi:hypothetical protein